MLEGCRMVDHVDASHHSYGPAHLILMQYVPRAGYDSRFTLGFSQFTIDSKELELTYIEKNKGLGSKSDQLTANL